MSKGGGSSYQVTNYHMSMHYGICHGPVDAMLGIFVKEKDAWPGTTVYDDPDDDPNAPEIIIDLTQRFDDWIFDIADGNVVSGERAVAIGPGKLLVNKPDLFGGDKKEGGVKGNVYWLPGRFNQTLPDVLAAKLSPGKTGAQVPGFRGIASLFFYSDDVGKGFLWGQNNPYLPAMWVTVYRTPLGLNPGLTVIQRGDYVPDVNPAHIIYECLTNTTWGMGAQSSIIDVDTFEACAVTLKEELFGLSMGWFQQAAIEDFIKEVLDHIQATLFINPRTGLITLKLIRDDYDPDDLREFGPDNCNAVNRQRKSWGETINEVVITWTNPATEEEETVTFQDLANISMQGSTVSDTRNYYGIRNKELASEVGVRDMRSASAPLFGCDIECDRAAWDLLPGEVCKFTWPEDGLESIIMRVGNIDYGKPGSPTIKATLLEDVFALELSEWDAPPTTEWVDDSANPTPLTDVQIFTIPYPALSAGGAQPQDSAYPQVVAGVLGASTNTDIINFDTMAEGVLPNGDPTIVRVATMNQVGRGTLQTALTLEATTTYAAADFGAIYGDIPPTVGSFAYVGAGTDAELEIIMFVSQNPSTFVWTIGRGVLDTVPREWPAGTAIWFVDDTFDGVDPGERVAFETVEYQMQTRTSLGLLPIENTPVETFTLSERPYLPFRPANVKIDGIAFTQVVYDDAAPTTIEFTWANRNRLLEDSIVKRWDAANVTPEVGQLTTIYAYDESDTEIMEIDGLSGTSYSLDYADLATANVAASALIRFKVVSVRDDFESLQGYEQTIELRFPGYGFSYGYYYGGD